MQETDDFVAESDCLARLLENCDDQALKLETQFKAWTIEDVIAHLHMWNVAAVLTLNEPEKFKVLIKSVKDSLASGVAHPTIEWCWLDETQGGLRGRALVDAWRGFYPRLALNYRRTDPAQRVAWGGPDMTAQAKVVARQMETWAHGQEVFDVLGSERAEGDRIKNICHLGVTTYGWSFRNRGEEPPLPKPVVRLEAPSGAIWEWNAASGRDEAISGKAVDFARVVTQVRNVADTNLRISGANAARWMAIAQCFAGEAASPPAKGARFMQSRTL